MARPAVYVMTNDQSGNGVQEFRRTSSGRLDAAGSTTLRTFGLGAGNAASPADPLTSQGALGRSGDGRFLFAVNAGSNDVTSIELRDAGPRFVDKTGSGGVRPISLCVHDDLLYVLNTGDANNPGTISGIRVGPTGRLAPIAGATRAVPGGAGVDSGAAQILFSPDGGHLIVLRLSNAAIDVFPVADDGTPGEPAAPVAVTGGTAFGSAFAGPDLLVVSDPGGAARSYKLVGDTLELRSEVNTGQGATCWTAVNPAEPAFAFLANAASSSITSCRINDDKLTLLDATDGATGPGSGPTDMAITSDGRLLYVVLGGSNRVLGFTVRPGINVGSKLDPVQGPGGSAPIFGGAQGIVAV